MRSKLQVRATIVPANTPPHRIKLGWRTILEKACKLQSIKLPLAATIYKGSEEGQFSFYLTEDNIIRRQTVFRPNEILETWFENQENEKLPLVLVRCESNNGFNYQIHPFIDLSTVIETTDYYDQNFRFVQLVPSKDISILVATFKMRSTEVEVSVEKIDIDHVSEIVDSISVSNDLFEKAADTGSKIFSFVKSILGKPPCKLTATFIFDSHDQNFIQLCGIQNVYLSI
jgi:hypothetical protein